jgi:hypothetical protein
MDLTFAINSCKYDAALVPLCTAALTKLYPNAKIVVVPDLAPNELKLPAHAGAWTERWMQQALAASTDGIIVKLDPDTRAYNAITSWPTQDAFGQIAGPKVYPGVKGSVIFGACIGFQRAAVAKIVQSQILLDAKYTVAPYLFTEFRSGREKRQISLQDPIMADVISRLGLSTGTLPNLYMGLSWHGVSKKIDLTKFAFAHSVRK